MVERSPKKHEIKTCNLVGHCYEKIIMCRLQPIHILILYYFSTKHKYLRFEKITQPNKKMHFDETLHCYSNFDAEDDGGIDFGL